MIINTRASMLLDMMRSLSKISKKNTGFGKNLLVDSTKDRVHIHASSSMVYGQAWLDAQVVEPGVFLLPISVIPFLQPLGDSSISLEITLDEIIINSDSNSIVLPQIGGDVGDVSMPTSTPKWSGFNIRRLKNIRYATGLSQHNLDVYWMVEDKIITTDRYRTAVYRPDSFNVKIEAGLYDFSTSLIDSQEMDVCIEERIWLGNDRYNISMPRLSLKIPTALLRLAEVPIPTSVTLNRDEFLNNVSLSLYLMDNEHIASLISLRGNTLMIKADTAKGGNESVQLIKRDDQTAIDLKVNTKYLWDVVNNCENKQINLCMITLGETPLLVIQDDDINHYLLPLRS